MKFFYLYKSLAHPETNNYVTPYTLKERLMHVAEAKKQLNTKFTWLCDGMDNAAKHALGDAPNSEFIFDPEGKVVVRRTWSNPEKLRKDLEKLIGPVEKPTRSVDYIKKVEPPKPAATGVVKRLELPGRLQALKIEPIMSDDAKALPFYAKLRAEADDAAVRTGKGKLYLGFFMDPLYHVHWNNLAEPIKFELTGGEGATITPNKGVGPKVEAPADMGPREFLIEIDLGDAKSTPLELTVDYFACNDEEGWCVPVRQRYRIHLEVDEDGGWSQKRGRGNAAAARRPGNRPGARLPEGVERLMGLVVNVDAEKGAVTLRLRAGGEETFIVDKSLPVNRDRKRSTIADLESGDRIMLGVQSERSDDGEVTKKVIRVMARSRSR